MDMSKAASLRFARLKKTLESSARAWAALRSSKDDQTRT
jgi:hypothetical protein